MVTSIAEIDGDSWSNDVNRHLTESSPQSGNAMIRTLSPSIDSTT
jgi:hypothetical protein